MGPSINIVTTSVDYGDFLTLTLPYMARLGHVHVVTSPHDQETIQLATNNPNVTGHITTAFYRCHGQRCKFNKAGALNEVVRELSGWVALIDADTIVSAAIPPNLDPSVLYSLQRMSLETWDDYQQFRQGERDFPLIRPQRTKTGYYRRFRNPAGLTGYFQLFHTSQITGDTSPLGQWPNASKYDIRFAARWPEHKRAYLPDGMAYHLGTPRRNWNGRVTNRFGAYNRKPK